MAAKEQPPDPATVEQLMRYGARLLADANVWFGHGNDNALDEAAELVIFGAGLRHEDAPGIYRRELGSRQREEVLQLLERRVRERVPAAYLTRRMWFAGHEFYVDERVLVPRSPLAETIEAGFAPWIEPQSVRTVLDIGTGSGCIAIASALALPDAHIDAADISDDALAVARINVDRYKLRERVELVRSDVFSGLAGRRYDVIVSNPPYVGRDEMAGLPEEYRREPSLGLYGGGNDGLDIVRRILREAPGHLQPHGILIVEVGNSEAALVAAFPKAPFTWIEFARGGGGVFLLTAEEAKRMADGRT